MKAQWPAKVLNSRYDVERLASGILVQGPFHPSMLVVLEQESRRDGAGEQLEFLYVVSLSQCAGNFCILGAKVTLIASKTKGNHANFGLKEITL